MSFLLAEDQQHLTPLFFFAAALEDCVHLFLEFFGIVSLISLAFWVKPVKCIALSTDSKPMSAADSKNLMQQERCICVYI